MKRITSLLILSFLAVNLLAQTAGKGLPAYGFQTLKENPITSVKNQASSGTCWCFSAMAFLESELLRMGKGEFDLSEMYIVRRNYEDKAQKYVRLHGHLNFAQGGSFADAIMTINQYGLMPDSEMTGLQDGETLHKHSEMESALLGYLKAVTDNKNGKLNPKWTVAFNGILDAFLGETPQYFEYRGKMVTPKQYAKLIGLAADNYLSFTSFTHHPFYSQFPIEVPDNWRWADSYNVPIDELMQIMYDAIDRGYTVAWASDVSEPGFTRTGLAVMPDETDPDVVGTDQAHWLGLSKTSKQTLLRDKIEKGPVKQLAITQEMRQKAYDNYETTDDHGMQIYGIAKDNMGNKYFLVKNSWGITGNFDGIWYASDSFVRYKTINIVVHKDAVPKDIAKKCGIN